MLCVFERSKRKEAAYLFMQWLNSPEVSLERVMLPYSLRDPFRLSHISSTGVLPAPMRFRDGRPSGWDGQGDTPR